ncbi:unnamed protein product, partial [Didymodactylos carnosus]
DQLISPMTTISSERVPSRHVMPSSNEEDNVTKTGVDFTRTKTYGSYKRSAIVRYEKYSDILNLDDFSNYDELIQTKPMGSLKTNTNLTDVDLADLPQSMSPRSTVRTIVSDVI